ncbi:Uncharacterised protein [uncultured Blautia sp.]|nr:Uncharacterised protein [uncultured Blautia sp.]
MAGTPTTNRLLEYRPSTSVRLELMPSSSTSAVISSGIVTTSPLRDASVDSSTWPSTSQIRKSTSDTVAAKEARRWKSSSCCSSSMSRYRPFSR